MRQPPPLWDVLPPQILVVLRGNPLADERGSVSVEASFRPGLDEDALLHCGLWARAHGQAYGIGIRSGGDHDADGTLWHWDGAHAVHVLLGRRQDIYGQ